MVTVKAKHTELSNVLRFAGESQEPVGILAMLPGAEVSSFASYSREQTWRQMTSLIKVKSRQEPIRGKFGSRISLQNDKEPEQNVKIIQYKIIPSQMAF